MKITDESFGGLYGRYDKKIPLETLIENTQQIARDLGLSPALEECWELIVSNIVNNLGSPSFCTAFCIAIIVKVTRTSFDQECLAKAIKIVNGKVSKNLVERYCSSLLAHSKLFNITNT